MTPDMYILDTNVVSEAISTSPDASVIAWLSSVEPENLFLTAITKAELKFGLEALPQGKRRVALTALVAGVLSQFEPSRILSFSAADADHYGTIAASRRAAGKPVREMDGQIAAIARRNSFAVVTRNARDFADCGIQVINPWEA